MKLAPKDAGRLLHLRRRAEDPTRWNANPSGSIDALGEDRFRQILSEVRNGPAGTRAITFTAEEGDRIRNAPNAPLETYLAHGVKIMHEVCALTEGGSIQVLWRQSSASRTIDGRREKLPERYFRDVLAKLGYGDGSAISLNPGSFVWHAKEDYASPAGDEVGSPLLSSPAGKDLARLCPLGRLILEDQRSLPAEVLRAFEGLSDLVLDEARGPGRYRFIGAERAGRPLADWTGDAAAPLIALMEKWLNHAALCPMCRATHTGDIS